MIRMYNFREDGKERYFTTTKPERVVPVHNVRVGREGDKKRELIGVLRLNGTSHPEMVEVPAGRWIFRSGIDLSTRIPAQKEYKLIGMEEIVW
jgi:hypothetical protein